jgi:transposase
MADTTRMAAALDMLHEETAISAVPPDGMQVAEAKVPICPDAVTDRLRSAWPEGQVPIVCIDARHANGVLKMMPNKTDRQHAWGLAQIVRTGWFKVAQTRSHEAYVNRAMLIAREARVGMRVKMENEIRGLLKTSGIILGKRVGVFRHRAGEIIEGELTVAPELLPFFEALTQTRRGILARIAARDSRIRSVVMKNASE